MAKIERVYDVELRACHDDDEHKREVDGYAVVFNARTDMGWFTEEIDKDAFNECDMSNVYLLFNHDENQILAGTTNGSLDMRIDEHGLFQSSKIIDTSVGEDVLKLVKNGLIRKMSFAFTIDGNGGEEWITNEDKDHRIIRKISKLYDVSLVTYPAYSQTSAYARSEGEDELAKEHKRRCEQSKKMEELINGRNAE